eukprot:2324444-Prymnesium_polylepis.1
MRTAAKLSRTATRGFSGLSRKRNCQFIQNFERETRRSCYLKRTCTGTRRRNTPGPCTSSGPRCPSAHSAPPRTARTACPTGASGRRSPCWCRWQWSRRGRGGSSAWCRSHTSRQCGRTPAPSG